MAAEPRAVPLGDGVVLRLAPPAAGCGVDDDPRNAPLLRALRHRAVRLDGARVLDVGAGNACSPGAKHRARAGRNGSIQFLLQQRDNIHIESF